MQKVTITTIDNICPFCGATRIETLEKTKAIECYCCHAQARLDCLSRVGSPDIQFIRILWDVPYDRKIGVLS